MQHTSRDHLSYNFKTTAPHPPVEWKISDGLVEYPEALRYMQKRVENIYAKIAHEQVWLLEHPSLYTAGTSANKNDLLIPHVFPVYEAGRGGEFTYHGPGQRIAYIMLDLKRRKQDIRAFISALEQWIIQTLAQFNIKGERREDRIGVWVVRPDRPSIISGIPAEDKIAAIGIRVRKWISFHGISINVDTDLTHYSGIVPCGITNHGVTSLLDLGLPITIHDVDNALKKAFEQIFGPTIDVS
ncbi:octanoyltransferase [Bartonella bacilliformis str. Heidi Mejia]|uniref:Octanoyltransferase n=2 Tax=Bartonella bacilliformis TaxID=774 RepID=LIPB_BARBK|nr:lipoyl(octanoyl) transferase LipB [Bartonella bacilliformis]A1UT80.1 RecName: Full=Octanoyltransferase; AltName: Full=Lipoate-protein ligase B; AltName: Full=Lipoyl/octanoyl transferase; AltName: Full=Octanoyl-[acyl-carrier-protein]-protein N-octanoyltransferase [Bartonella bacilliformis KC583]ABM45682.1 lipoyltransferase [Bartonella bacilliformis KC583]AMG85960.1 lipoate-protein ligase B [Bartonella bacilliformis]EKS43639.1 lipoate-protein ligase B [Bartonella bacilliformis INS]EYS89725.1 